MKLVHSIALALAVTAVGSSIHAQINPVQRAAR